MRSQTEALPDDDQDDGAAASGQQPASRLAWQQQPPALSGSMKEDEGTGSKPDGRAQVPKGKKKEERQLRDLEAALRAMLRDGTKLSGANVLGAAAAVVGGGGARLKNLPMAGEKQLGEPHVLQRSMSITVGMLQRGKVPGAAARSARLSMLVGSSFSAAKLSQLQPQLQQLQPSQQWAQQRQLEDQQRVAPGASALGRFMGSVDAEVPRDSADDLLDELLAQHQQQCAATRSPAALLKPPQLRPRSAGKTNGHSWEDERSQQTPGFGREDERSQPPGSGAARLEQVREESVCIGRPSLPGQLEEGSLEEEDVWPVAPAGLLGGADRKTNGQELNGQELNGPPADNSSAPQLPAARTPAALRAAVQQQAEALCAAATKLLSQQRSLAAWQVEAGRQVGGWVRAVQQRASIRAGTAAAGAATSSVTDCGVAAMVHSAMTDEGPPHAQQAHQASRPSTPGGALRAGAAADAPQLPDVLVPARGSPSARSAAALLPGRSPTPPHTGYTGLRPGSAARSSPTENPTEDNCESPLGSGAQAEQEAEVSHSPRAAGATWGHVPGRALAMAGVKAKPHQAPSSSRV